MIKYYTPDNPDVLFDVVGDPATICRKFGYLSKEVPTPLSDSDTYLKGYYEATRQLLTLATGTTPTSWIKLEDVEYQAMCIRAAGIDAVQCQVLTSTIMYCFFQLKFLGIEWDSFQYPENV